MTASVEDTERASPGEGPAGGGPGRPRLSRGRVAVLVVAIGALIAILLLTDRGPAPDAIPQPAPGVGGELPIDPLTGLPEGYRTHRDDVSGFTVAHPETWVPIARPEGSLRLRLNAGGDNSMSVRHNLNDEAVDTEADLQKALPATDRLAQGTGGVDVVKRQAFNLHGINGISYLSRFTDEDTGRSLVNAQYFLFQGRDMFIVLFQAAPDPPVEPEDEFERMLNDINAVLDSFTIDPAVPEEPANAG